MFQLCATLGTTGSCSFDNLKELGPICKYLQAFLLLLRFSSFVRFPYVALVQVFLSLLWLSFLVRFPYVAQVQEFLLLLWLSSLVRLPYVAPVHAFLFLLWFSFLVRLPYVVPPQLALTTCPYWPRVPTDHLVPCRWTGRAMDARGRGLRGHGLHLSGVPALYGRHRLRPLAGLQPFQVDDGPLRLHRNVVCLPQPPALFSLPFHLPSYSCLLLLSLFPCFYYLSPLLVLLELFSFPSFFSDICPSP